MSHSYFEIGGQLVECTLHNTSIPSPLPSASSFRGAPTDLPVSQVQAKRKKWFAGGRKADRTSKWKVPGTPGSSLSSRDTVDKNAAAIVGGGAIRTGVAILMVPDPLPLVDEIAAFVLIAGGVALVAYGES